MNKSLPRLNMFLMTFLAVIITFLNTGQVLAQTRSISGVIKDDTQSPLPGVSVIEKGTNNGTVTDADGKFSLSVRENATLVLSFIGMIPQEVVVGTQTSFELTMESDVRLLGEVVVIGYGTVERRDLTSSVSSIGAKQIKDIPINSAAQALAGRLAGVQVTAAEGSPNADVQIRVRGGGSITQDNSPIFIVDGMQVENALSVLSPQDIESIDVLKDAAATAIYGARGANGIVIITTKGGRQQKTSVTFSSLVGVRQLANKLDVWKPYDFVKYQYERSRGGTTSEANFLSDYGAYEDIELYKGVPFVDWQDKVFGRSALMQTYNVGVTGGGKVTQYNVSLTSNTEEGVMIGSDFDRKLLNARIDNTFGRFKVGMSGRLNHTVVNGAGTATPGSSGTNRLRHSVKYRPFVGAGQPIDYYDPDYALETNANSLSLVNPILLAQQEYQQELTNVSNINGYVSFKINDFLSFKSSVGFDNSRERTRVFNDTITSASKSNGQGQPIGSLNYDKATILNNSNVLTFSSEGLKSVFGTKHKLDVIAGHEVFEKKSNIDFRGTRIFPVGITPLGAFEQFESAATIQPLRTEEFTERLLSFFGRANYSYNDKYLVTLSYRKDGSSKFAEGRKWGSFPGASLAWRISSEPFFNNLTRVMSEFKLRASYGASGNNRIPNFLYLSLFEPAASGFYSLNEQNIVGYVPSDLANSNLQWEGIVSKNIGVDAGLFSNRLQLSVDYYNNSSVDLLLERVIPSTSGYVTQIQNIGETSNKGVEIQLSGTPVDRGEFTWNANFNISFNENKIESLGPDLVSYLQSSGWAGGNQPSDYIVKVGHQVGTVWGLETDGFYKVDDFNYDAGTGTYTLKEGVPTNQGITSVAPRPGVMKFRDLTGDGLITDDDRTIIGRTSPKFYGGLNQQFTYKNFDLSVFVNFQYGNDVLNANKLEFSSGYTVNSNLLSVMDGRWRNVNDEGQVVTDPVALTELNKDATLWSPLTTASSFYVHSWAIEDGSFIRLNNITLGYSLPQSLFTKLKIKNFRIYGTLNNLAVFTKYSGYDPEVNTRRSSRLTPGVDFSAYPRSRGYIFGLNVTF